MNPSFVFQVESKYKRNWGRILIKNLNPVAIAIKTREPRNQAQLIASIVTINVTFGTNPAYYIALNLYN